MCKFLLRFLSYAKMGLCRWLRKLSRAIHLLIAFGGICQMLYVGYDTICGAMDLYYSVSGFNHPWKGKGEAEMRAGVHFYIKRCAAYLLISILHWFAAYSLHWAIKKGQDQKTVLSSVFTTWRIHLVVFVITIMFSFIIEHNFNMFVAAMVVSIPLLIIENKCASELEKLAQQELAIEPFSEIFIPDRHL